MTLQEELSSRQMAAWFTPFLILPSAVGLRLKDGHATCI